jgi:hypothetical protein
MQHISREKREDDLPEGVLTVSLLKHQVYESCQILLFATCIYAGYHVPYTFLLLERKWH